MSNLTLLEADEMDMKSQRTSIQDILNLACDEIMYSAARRSLALTYAFGDDPKNQSDHGQAGDNLALQGGEKFFHATALNRFAQGGFAENQANRVMGILRDACTGCSGTTEEHFLQHLRDTIDAAELTRRLAR